MIPGGPGSMQFYDVLNKRNSPGVKHLVLKEGVSVNHRFADGSFPVHIAAEKGDIESLRFLLSMKANPDVKNRHGQTALMLGIENVSVVQELVIEYNSKVDLRDSQQRAALHLAAARGLINVVCILLAGGATVNAHDAWNRSPLHVALLNLSHAQTSGQIGSYAGVVKLLIDRGCDINQKDKHRATPLFLAINSGNLKISQMLITRNANIDQVSRHKLTPIMLATMKGFIKLCQLLLWHNCNLTYVLPSQGKTCLQLAIQKGFFEIAILLSAAGGNLHSQNWMFYKHKEQWQSRSKHITKEMWDWLDVVFSTPISLQQTCRTEIRRCIGKNFQRKLEKIKYSELLKKYICLGDVMPPL